MSVVEKLYRDYGNFVLDISNWELLDRGVTALWGPSGAGKSSIINVLLGLDSKAEVSWVWEGQDIGKWSSEKRKLGVVFQDLGLFSHMTAKENILFPVDKKRRTQWESEFDKLVSELDLAHCLDQETHRLSGGEQQRVALARALIYQPRMLLLDEPFASLDESLREVARNMVLRLCRDLECPVLLVTHDPKDVDVMADRVCQLQRGKIVQVSKTLSKI